jgi:uncharacterized 2Fe-2S/4Fe-4S cluster protein (DUF4445 family)
MIPPINPGVVMAAPNGAGFGAAMFLSDEGLALAEKLVMRTRQIDLDKNTDFINHFIRSMEF